MRHVLTVAYAVGAAIAGLVSGAEVHGSGGAGISDSVSAYAQAGASHDAAAAVQLLGDSSLRPSGTRPPSPTPAPGPARVARGNKDAAGGLTVTEPAQTADPSYYKIAAHETITFGWSFTSLSKTPKHLYVIASCSSNSNTYPIAPSPTGIPGTATEVKWYPYGYGKSAHAQGNPDLVAGKYRLIIYGDQGPSAVPSAGELTPNNHVEFSLYYPRAYTPLPEWHCTACNGATNTGPKFGVFVACAVALLSAAWLVAHP